MLRAFALSLVSSLLVATSAFADTVVLDDGGTVEGVVVESGNRVTVHMDVGSIEIDAQDVVEIRRAPNQLSEFRSRNARLRSEDIAGRMSLASWCKRRGLQSRARVLYREVLGINPNHPGARQALGHRKVAGEWLTRHQQREAAGEVFHLGEWVSAEEAEKRDAEIDSLREKRKARQTERNKAIAAAQAAAPPNPPEPFDQQSYGGSSTSWWWAPNFGGAFGSPGFFPAGRGRPGFRAGGRFPGRARMRNRSGRVIRPGVRLGFRLNGGAGFRARSTFGGGRR